MYKKTFLALLVFLFLIVSPTVRAQTTENENTQPKDEYLTGTIQEIHPYSNENAFGLEHIRIIDITLDNESQAKIKAEYTDTPEVESDNLKIGERVVLFKSTFGEQENVYRIIDRYRLPSLAFLLAIFFLCGIIFAGRKGFTGILGLGISLTVLLAYTIPSIINGSSPFIVASISAFIIAFLSISVAHGFSKQTGIALVSTLATLTLSLGLSQFFVKTAKLVGVGSEESYSLAFAGLENIDLRGLLLAGIIIGVLGVLDDVTTAQTAAVKNLARAGQASFKHLYKSSIDIGKEHIVSLINTLALAYVGASLPLLLLFHQNESQTPIWTILNSELIAEEIIRTLVGSTALILAVPISTIIATWYYSKQNLSK